MFAKSGSSLGLSGLVTHGQHIFYIIAGSSQSILANLRFPAESILRLGLRPDLNIHRLSLNLGVGLMIGFK